jgi:hypothetical protein
MNMLTTARVWMEQLSFKFREPVNVGILVGKKHSFYSGQNLTKTSGHS